MSFWTADGTPVPAVTADQMREVEQPPRPKLLASST